MTEVFSIIYFEVFMCTFEKSIVRVMNATNFNGSMQNVIGGIQLLHVHP